MERTMLFDDNLVPVDENSRVQRDALRAEILEFKRQMDEGTSKNLWLSGTPATGCSFYAEACFGPIHEHEGPEDTYVGPEPTVVWEQPFDFEWFNNREAKNLVIHVSNLPMDQVFEGGRLGLMRSRFTEIQCPLISYVE